MMRFQRALVVFLLVLFTVLVSATSFVAGASLHGDVAAVLSSRLPIVGGDTRPLATTETRLALFRQVWDIVDHEYYGRPLNYDQMIQGAIQGMLDTLGDPHTQYLNPDHNAIMSDHDRGSFQGIGATLDRVNDQFVIVAPLPDSPAEKAGLHAGDVLLAVDGQDLAGLNLMDVVLKVRGPVGSKVVLTVKRDGVEAPFDVAVERAEIPLRTVTHQLLDDETGYVAVSSFSTKTVEELDAALADLKARGAQRLILDLRDNPGGFLDAAVEVIGRFVARGTALYWQNSDGSTRNIPIRERDDVVQWPMVVLVNGGSASAAEIVAGALQDYGRALLVGEKTFGKGSVQNVHQLSDGGSLRVTTAHWLTPKKHDINGVSLTPDVVISRPETDAQAGRDPQLAWARSYLGGTASRSRWMRGR
jgi:carboxyl-terminal processing protease